jgi:protein-S-isoprenylcysteine O-methyltransferase Ste14
MARPGFKGWWTRTVAPSIERRTYVFISDVLMVLLLWQWRPMPDVIWDVQSPVGRTVLWVLFWTGWGTLLAASWVIDHFELFGRRQVYRYARGQSYQPTRFKASLFYKIVRHPLMLGWLLGFWSTPHRTVGYLVFAVGTTVYILLEIQLQERDLVALHGEEYMQYRKRVPMLIPFLRKMRGPPTAE